MIIILHSVLFKDGRGGLGRPGRGSMKIDELVNLIVFCLRTFALGLGQTAQAQMKVDGCIEIIMLYLSAESRGFPLACLGSDEGRWTHLSARCVSLWRLLPLSMVPRGSSG